MNDFKQQVIVTTTSIGTYAFFADSPEQARAAIISVFFSHAEDGTIDDSHEFFDEAFNGLDESAILALMGDYGHLFEVITLIDSTQSFHPNWQRNIRLFREIR